MTYISTMSKIYNSVFVLGTLLELALSAELRPNWWEEKNTHGVSVFTADFFEKIAKATASKKFEDILDPILVPRVVGTEQHTAVKEYIKKEMKNLGWTIETDSFNERTPIGEKSFENIIATLNPDTPRRLVLACHFDSLYRRNPNNFVGATDSAVPCAMLIHIAQALKDLLAAHKKSTNQSVTLQFLFFDGEEAFDSWTGNDNTYGSRHLATLWGNTPYPPATKDKTNMLSRMDMLVLLDLIGASSPSFPNYFPSTGTWFNFLMIIEKLLRGPGPMQIWEGNPKTPLYFVNTGRPSAIQDDHMHFERRGVRIIHLITNPFPTVWHTDGDSKKVLDFPTIENFNRIMRIFVATYLDLQV